MPPAEQVRDALARVLASEVFARSERARDLLRYLVEQDLAGNGDRLKGFSIAVDVFGRDGSFDPSTDAVVRVQAGRLRDLLDHYYAGPGADEKLRISIPRGSYVPDYVVADEAVAGTAIAVPEAEAAETEASMAPPPERARRPAAWPPMAAWAAIGILAVTVMGYSLFPARDGTPTATGATLPALGAADRTGAAVHALLPSVFLEVDAQDEASARIAASLRRGLAGFDTIHFIARPPSPDVHGAHRRTDFVFIARPAAAEGSVALELQNVLTGKVLLLRRIETVGRSEQAIDDEIAGILTQSAPVSGVIYAGLAEAGVQTPLTRCLMLNDRFYRDQGAVAHREAYRCLEELAGEETGSALVYSELASLHLQAITDGYDYPARPSSEQALEYARMAVQLQPTSPYAHRSMGHVLSRTASPDEALRWTRRAYELNTFDLGMAASYGYALVFTGDYGTGTPILDRAVAAASAHPTWWDYGLSLGRFMLGDMRAAADAASTLAASERVHYVAIRLVAADALGESGRAAALLTELQAKHPRFSADPERFYRRGDYPDDMIMRLVEALRTAGLGGAS